MDARRTVAGGWGAPFVMAAWAAAGCSTPEEQMTPTEWLRENTTVLEDLESFEQDRQRDALQRITALGEPRRKAVVLALLMESRLEYRAEVVLARLLANWGDARAVPYLLKYLRHPDDGAVDLAVQGLLAFRDSRRVREALIEMLSDPAPRERLTAAEVLCELSDAEIVGRFMERYRDEPDRVVRGALLRGVLRSAAPGRSEFLIQTLGDSDEAIREMAWRALEKDPRVPQVAYDPHGDAAERADAVARLRMWVKTAGR